MRTEVGVVSCCLVIAFAVPAAADDLPAVAPSRAEFLAEYDDSARKLSELAHAIPAERYAWRPAPGVRSPGEVFQHVSNAIFYLAERTGVARPAEAGVDLETLAAKSDVLHWLEVALRHGRSAAASASVAELGREVELYGGRRTVAGIQLRMLLHMNEHLGQLVAYARSIGVAPPWSVGG